jgi:hypothetical protein
MITPDYIRTMAEYNAEMNRRLYGAAARLSDPERRLPRGAFWGSIHGTLTHILWGDQLPLPHRRGARLVVGLCHLPPRGTDHPRGDRWCDCEFPVGAAGGANVKPEDHPTVRRGCAFSRSCVPSSFAPIRRE